MKKIGIITFHNTTNYGAMLQVFALQQKLIQLGCDCRIVNYHCENIELREFVKFPKYKNNVYRFLSNIKEFIMRTKKRKIMKNFSNQNLILSENEYDRSTIRNANNTFDAFIVGSDMVWELGITNGDMTYYLDFADIQKRYSYAASIGVEKIEPKYIDECTKNLNLFRHISVREEQAKKLIQSLTKNEVHVNADPTLLHDATFWRNIAKKPSKFIEEKYILLYFLDSKGIILEKAKEIASKNGLSIVIFLNRNKKIDGCKTVANATVEEFLYYIDNAELVITGSYHGMIFSMNFNTNFMYFNRANSSRMESIATITNATDRRLTEDFVPELNCNFDSINNSISLLKADSEKYLRTIINE